MKQTTLQKDDWAVIVGTTIRSNVNSPGGMPRYAKMGDLVQIETTDKDRSVYKSGDFTQIVMTTDLLKL